MVEFNSVKWKLGVDLDNPSQLQLLITYFNGKYNYGSPSIYVTKKGYHLEFNVPTSIEARAGLCDDKRRMELSELRYIVSGVLDDVLFDWKWDGKKWRKRERIESGQLLCKPFWLLPRRKNGRYK